MSWGDILSGMFEGGGLDVTQKALQSPEGMASYNAIPAWKNPNIQSSIFGNLARMLSAPGSWQGVLGGAAGDLGTSNQANVYSKSEQMKRDALNKETMGSMGKILRGLFSPGDAIGGNTMTMKGDGTGSYNFNWKDTEPLTEDGNDLGLKKKSDGMGGMVNFDYENTLNPQGGGTTSPFQSGQTGDVGSVYRFGLNPEQITEQDKVAMAGEQAGLGNYIEGAKLAAQAPLLKAHANYYNAQNSPEMQNLAMQIKQQQLRKEVADGAKSEAQALVELGTFKSQIAAGLMKPQEIQSLINSRAADTRLTNLNYGIKKFETDSGLPQINVDKAKADLNKARFEANKLFEQLQFGDPEIMRKNHQFLQELEVDINDSTKAGAAPILAAIFNRHADIPVMYVTEEKPGTFYGSSKNLKRIDLPITKKGQVWPKHIYEAQKAGVPLEQIFIDFGINIRPRPGMTFRLPEMESGGISTPRPQINYENTLTGRFE